MNNDKRFVGTFQTETELVAKVQELKTSGISDNNIYVIAKDDHDLHMLRSRTDAEVKTTEGSWMDKFMNFLSGENHVDHLMDGTGMSEAEKDRYTREVNDGAMLLYVDEGEADTYANDNNLRYSAADSSNDANLATDGYAAPFGMAGGLEADRTKGALHDEVDPTATDRVKHADTAPLRNESGLNRSIEEVPETMKVHEERLKVDKQQVQKGEVTVDKNVVEDRKTVDIPVEHEEITIERRPVSEETAYTDSGLTGEDNLGASNTFDEETIRVPVTEEKIEVTKKPVVTEEIVINKKRVTDTEHVDETVKREEVDVTREGETNDVNFKGNLTDTDRNRTDKF
ncbi:YsnF/AvaK domain-containing protein [Sporosarcina aquimarina]|uniref:YsnF/AvaK domain-containing protein n=1 Tax=Sporosarcina aquimarina TaxID=114975 RepID=A0ABU4FVV7_9BACL|nr:YsnF/AvaK domain-containing protein [Sporosarcina aquimarina]MDW0108844.1 YsnF/AvaK domain-containing protein [Sporosarcina aquimarina]